MTKNTTRKWRTNMEIKEKVYKEKGLLLSELSQQGGMAMAL
jgi:hypothetical protein